MNINLEINYDEILNEGKITSSKKLNISKKHIGKNVYCIFYTNRRDFRTYSTINVDTIYTKLVRLENSSGKVLFKKEDIGRECIIVLNDN